MKRPITLASGQFGDMSLEELCKMAGNMGYEGLELATHAHFDVKKALGLSVGLFLLILQVSV